VIFEESKHTGDSHHRPDKGSQLSPLLMAEEEMISLRKLKARGCAHFAVNRLFRDTGRWLAKAATHRQPAL
jgi:hypothetical protein